MQLFRVPRISIHPPSSTDRTSLLRILSFMTIYGDNGVKNMVLKDSIHLLNILKDANGNWVHKDYAITTIAHGLEAALPIESEYSSGVFPGYHISELLIVD